MRIIQFLLYVLLSLHLSGCAPATPPIMPPLKYDKPIKLHIPKNAYLNWEVGKQYASIQPSNIAPNGGLIGTLIATTVDSELRKSNPSRYELSYGKAQQAIFMTSLKNALAQHHVFNKVKLITEPQKIHPQDVLITIYFRKTRVTSAYESNRTLLHVDMTIKTADDAPFKRSYFIESNSYDKTYQQQQTEASQELLEKIISGISQWHTHTN